MIFADLLTQIRKWLKEDQEKAQWALDYLDQDNSDLEEKGYLLGCLEQSKQSAERLKQLINILSTPKSSTKIRRSRWSYQKSPWSLIKGL